MVLQGQKLGKNPRRQLLRAALQRFQEARHRMATTGLGVWEAGMPNNVQLPGRRAQLVIHPINRVMPIVARSVLLEGATQPTVSFERARKGLDSAMREITWGGALEGDHRLLRTLRVIDATAQRLERLMDDAPRRKRSS